MFSIYAATLAILEKTLHFKLWSPDPSSENSHFTSFVFAFDQCWTSSSLSSFPKKKTLNKVQSGLLKKHALLSLPVQVNPSPVYPELHVQGDSADVPVQDELRLQPILRTDELSANENNNKETDCEPTFRFITPSHALWIDPYGFRNSTCARRLESVKIVLLSFQVFCKFYILLTLSFCIRFS